MDFSSDTAAPAHPKVIEALAAVNQGSAPSYGADAVTARLRQQLHLLDPNYLMPRQHLARPHSTAPRLGGTAMVDVL